MQYTLPSPMTVLEALRTIYPDSSRRTLQTWLKNGRFFVDGRALQKEGDLLDLGQTIHAKETFRAPKVPGLKILYEDRWIIVIDKPTGLLSVPLDDTFAKRNALNLLRQYYGSDQIFAVHRIDRETSGILLFARGKESEQHFDALFERHDILREYLTIVEGRVEQQTGTWQSNLLELPSLQVIDSPDGKEAITHFSVIRKSAKYSYLRLRLETGRKHQIRVHCQMAGHPVLGDFRYGAKEDPLKRLCLHAATLGFKHPFTHKSIQFSSPVPPIFKRLGAF